MYICTSLRQTIAMRTDSLFSPSLFLSAANLLLQEPWCHCIQCRWWNHTQDMGGRHTTCQGRHSISIPSLADSSSIAMHAVGAVHLFVTDILCRTLRYIVVVGNCEWAFQHVIYREVLLYIQRWASIKSTLKLSILFFSLCPRADRSLFSSLFQYGSQLKANYHAMSHALGQHTEEHSVGIVLATEEATSLSEAQANSWCISHLSPPLNAPFYQPHLFQSVLNKRLPALYRSLFTVVASSITRLCIITPLHVYTYICTVLLNII